MGILSSLSSRKYELHYPFGQPPEGLDVVWYCKAQSYSYVIDADREEYGTTAPRLELRWYEVTRRTAKCVELRCLDIGLVRIYALRCPYKNTPEEALMQFRRRRERQIRILKNQLATAEFELDLVKAHTDTKEVNHD